MNITKQLIVCFAVGVCGTAAWAAETGHHWAYKGAQGPEHWGDLSTEYASCSTGRMQSPIDLAEADTNGAVDYSVDYKATPLTILNNGHTVQVNMEAGGKLMASGVAFDLAQIHFHAPSEHVVQGKHYPLEAHFVHKSADGTLAVLGVFIEEGADNAALAAIIDHLPQEKSEPKTFSETQIDPNNLLPENRNIYRYAGSLTTPPCSEGVKWHVLSSPVTASKEQITKLSAVMGMNARPVQERNLRLLVAPTH